MRIEKKVLPEYFQQIIDGIKKYELRIADFEAGKGDILILREWDAKNQEYTGRTVEKEITMVLKTKDLLFFKQEDIEKFGYQIISFD